MKKRLEMLIAVSLLFMFLSSKAMSSQLQIPTAKSPYIASSALTQSNSASYGPEKVFDYNDSTAWCENAEGVGVGEWVAIYLGEGEKIGRFNGLDVVIYTGYRKDKSIYGKNGKPTKMKIELFNGRNAVASLVSGPSDIYKLLKTSANYKGGVWIKITILNAISGSKYKDTCISEIKTNFKNANPFKAREAARKACNSYSVKQYKLCPNKNELNINILSSTSFEFMDDGTEMGENFVRYSYNDNKWKKSGESFWFSDPNALYKEGDGIE